MRIASLNMIHNGSTGKIMLQIASTARAAGCVTKTYSPVRFFRGRKMSRPTIPNHFFWGSWWESFFHYYAGSIFGMNGIFSLCGTHKLINDLKKFKPDIIHLHNLHAFCINFPLLFAYIKKNNIKVVWTFHDCWAFTGHCPHFVIAGCDKWKSGCHSCPSYKSYPKSFYDNSKFMWRWKKKWFCGIKDMTIVTPSQWLAELVKQSFLSEYPVKVINNGIDLSIFKPVDSDFRVRYNIQDKKIILGVSFGWGYSKGIDVFCELAKRLDASYQIVLVGTDGATDATLPKNIISIHRTDSQAELAEIYSAADVFVNPTRSDTYPTVNMESVACGTPVVTFKTGGSPEILSETCGCVVDVDDIDAMEKEVIRVCNNKPFSENSCVERAGSFNMNDRFEEYVKLYKEINENENSFCH